MRKLKILAATLGAILVPSLLFAATEWGNWPIVGGASYCSSYVTYNTTASCVNTVPAGPSKTGNEVVPASTLVTGGANPQQVLMSMADLNALPLSLQTLVPTGATLFLTPSSTDAGLKIGGYIINSAAALTPTIDIWMPTSPVQGQVFSVSTQVSIAAALMTTSDSSTIKLPLTALTPTANTGGSAGAAWSYNVSDTTWYRIR